MTKGKIKKFWEQNKPAICFGLGVAASVGIKLAANKIFYTENYVLTVGEAVDEKSAVLKVFQEPRKKNYDINTHPGVVFRFTIDEISTVIKALQETADYLKSLGG